MGYITVFTVDDCTHCNRVKTALSKYDIPYKEINVTRYPSKRDDLLALTGKVSLPQVFFNARPVGGTDATIELLEEWDADKTRYSTAKDRYVAEIQCQSDPISHRLRVPDAPPALPSFRRKSSTRHICNLVLPNDDCVTVVDLTESLKRILPIEDNKHNLTVYKKSFVGSKAVRSLMMHYSIGKEKAVEYGRYLQESNILDHVVGDHAFDDCDYFFRLHCHQTPDVINSYRVWNKEIAPSDCFALLKRLTKMVNWIESTIASDEDGKLDYKQASKDPSFPALEDAICAFQKVDLQSMDDNTKLAFGMNLYNLMIKYAFMKVGYATTELGRMAFFAQVKFNVGGYVFSFLDWEHGFLRGNAKAPLGAVVSSGRQFKDNDPRVALCVKRVDARIHFGLNCGAKSCPPVRHFSPDKLQEELALCALAYCEQDDNVYINAKGKEVQLSKIFSWYKSDFVTSESDLPNKLLDYLRGEKRGILQAMLDGSSGNGGNGRRDSNGNGNGNSNNNSGVRVHFRRYDWTIHAQDNFRFDTGNIKSKNLRLQRVVRREDTQQGQQIRSL